MMGPDRLTSCAQGDGGRGGQQGHGEMGQHEQCFMSLWIWLRGYIYLLHTYVHAYSVEEAARVRMGTKRVVYI